MQKFAAFVPSTKIKASMSLYPIHTGNFKLTEAPCWVGFRPLGANKPADEKLMYMGYAFFTD